MTAATIPELVRAHILATCRPDKRHLQFGDASSLVETGILDSVAVFELVAFLEGRFGIEVADDELRWNNFESVEAITRLVMAKIATGPVRT